LGSELRIVAVLIVALLVQAFGDGSNLPDSDAGQMNGAAYDSRVAEGARPSEGAGIPEAPLDTSGPTIVITSPKMNAVIAAPTITVAGTASDDVALAKVEVSLDGTHWLLTNGTSSWSVTLSLAVGGYWIRARAMDTSQKTNTTGIWVEVIPERTIFESFILPLGLLIIPVAAIVGLLADVVIWRRKMRERRRGA
jgi:hypothetical protein